MSTIQKEYVRWFRRGPQNKSPYFMAQVYGTDGTLLTQDEVDSIDYVVYDLRLPSISVSVGILSELDVIFDTPKNDERWCEDSIGYNFATYLDGTIFSQASTTYSIEFNITEIQNIQGDSPIVPIDYRYFTVNRLRDVG